jgi:hypothetical protein
MLKTSPISSFDSNGRRRRASEILEDSRNWPRSDRDMRRRWAIVVLA